MKKGKIPTGWICENKKNDDSNDDDGSEEDDNDDGDYDADDDDAKNHWADGGLHTGQLAPPILMDFHPV